MRNEEILILAFGKAKENGWVNNPSIFSHEFAKAFWGFNIYPLIIGNRVPIHKIDYLYDWEYHLQQMVLEEEPIKYLEGFL